MKEIGDQLVVENGWTAGNIPVSISHSPQIRSLNDWMRLGKYVF